MSDECYVLTLSHTYEQAKSKYVTLITHNSSLITYICALFHTNRPLRS